MMINNSEKVILIVMAKKMSRILIHGGNVITLEGVYPLDILINDGHIVGLYEPGEAPHADKTINASQTMVLPGAIDGHSHFFQQDPQADVFDAAAFEGFTNGGRGAAAGGITTVVEMPQAIPPTTNATALLRKRDLAAADAIVDFAFWGGAISGQPVQAIRDQIEAGAVGFKAFLCNDDPDFPALNDSELKILLETLKETSIMLSLHAENDSLVQANREKLQASGRVDPLAYIESRPPIVEAEAVNRVIFFAERTGGWAHITHMSSPDAAELVCKAKQRGVRLTAETCPHFLAMDIEYITRLGPYAKCAPPLRTKIEVEKLWEYLIDGTIDCVTSDHCSWSKASKDAGLEDIWKAPNGLPGIQTLLPVMITEARRRGCSWKQIVQWTALTPAKLWHLAPKKGSIRVGGDADLVLIDPEREWVLHNEDLLHYEHWTPLAGQTFRGRIIRTLVRGETVFLDEAKGKITVRPGFGQYIPPQTAH
jgi:allantoinase